MKLHNVFLSHFLRKRALALFIVLSMTIVLAAGVAADGSMQSAGNADTTSVEPSAPANASNDLTAKPPEGSSNFHKNETIYGVMDQDGGLIRVEVVNHLSGGAGSWIDYGVYTEIGRAHV